MRVLGVHVAIRDNRYLAGFAVVDDDHVDPNPFTLGGPPDESESGQLRELHSRTLRLVEEKAPQRVALRVSEIQGSANRAAIAHRAEGAVLAAVGETRGLEVQDWKRASLQRVSGSSDGRSVAVANALCAQLQNPPSEPEQRQAAAAAVASLIEAGAL
jgi:hypothetical protein